MHELITSRDLEAVLIPDGDSIKLKKGSAIFIQQVLGGMFTIQTDDGSLLRIDGKDADAIGQPIPEERKKLSLEEVTSKGLEHCVGEILKTCYDPEIPVNIVDLGLIYEIDIKQDAGMVRIEMTLTAPGCGMGEVLKSDIEKKLADIPSIKSVIVDLVFDPPWESSMMSEAAKLQLGFL